MQEDSKNKRIENLLALIVLNSLKGAGLPEKALQLSLAGFSNIEIANLLRIKSQTVANVLFEARKKKKKKKA